MNNMPTRVKRLFLLKIDLPALLAFILFAGMIFLYLIPAFEKVMMDRKRNLIHEMTSSVYSLLEHYHAMETEGLLDSLTARAEAKSAINAIRYGGDRKDYFWITDMYPRMIAHPYRPDLNGKDLTDFRDSTGKAIFVEFVRAVSHGGESYVDYMWQWNDDSARIVPKLSYVRLFEPWQWVVGTGIYIEDVRTEIRRMEMRALLISGVFGIVILALLLAISRQSHKLEIKRSSTEEELRKSRELYRTLAEAASEGVVIWSRRGLQANKTLLSWIEYTEEELQQLKITDVIGSQEIAVTDDPEALFDDLSTRLYLECQLKIRNGSIINSHADLSRIMLGDNKAVMVVIRPVRSLSSHPDMPPPDPLLNYITTGFFRITYGKKSRFTDATKPVLDLLGFNDLQELKHHTVETLFADPVQLMEFRHSLAERENIYGREVLIRKNNGSEIRALLSIIIVEAGAEEIWCEGTIEPLSVAAFGHDTLISGTAGFAASFMMEAPVSAYMRPHAECSENTPVSRILTLMEENDISVVTVINQSGMPMGVIDSGMIGFRLSGGASPETEAYRLMQSPPAFIKDTAPLEEAFGRMKNRDVACLLVTTTENRVAGVVTLRELVHAYSLSPRLIQADIARAGSPGALRTCFLNSRKTAIAMLRGHADPWSVSLHLSSTADEICRRVLEICIEEAGPPPCRFAFIQTGSAGRMEQSLLTDQDNAFILENHSGKDPDQVNKYFLPLGKKVNNMLAATGYHLCKGDNMAGNPKWCQPVETWKNHFSEWIRTPGPSELLDVSIFFDFRFCYGDASLCDELRDWVKRSLRTNDIYFYHMSLAWKQFAPSQSMLAEEKTDIKRILMPLTGIIRLYALKHGLDSLPTLDRILDLHRGKHIDGKLLLNTLRAWKDLASIRFFHQASCIERGDEPDNYPDFLFRESHLRHSAAQAIEEINTLLLKAGNDFHSVTI
jgi:signal-transduction protein with cAMP-binding, CBS, and nucleotidyltransferase domain/PAS domain-containing protein